MDLGDQAGLKRARGTFRDSGNHIIGVGEFRSDPPAALDVKHSGKCDEAHPAVNATIRSKRHADLIGFVDLQASSHGFSRMAPWT